MRANRGTLTEPGKNSPFRDRPVEESLRLFATCATASIGWLHILRAKIDMASPNMNLRDPAIYRIRHATTTTPATSGASTRCTLRASHRGRAGKHLPLICTLEFEDQRPFYDWLLEQLSEAASSRSRCRASTNSRA
jgi:glutaminyl-tRNA synthetase